jgi:hypothetical protein
VTGQIYKDTEEMKIDDLLVIMNASSCEDMMKEFIETDSNSNNTSS